MNIKWDKTEQRRFKATFTHKYVKLDSEMSGQPKMHYRALYAQWSRWLIQNSKNETLPCPECLMLCVKATETHQNTVIGKVKWYTSMVLLQKCCKNPSFLTKISSAVKGLFERC